ncbi:MAG: O-antigen ligase family protein [Patescibacteria group bacterium]|nr:O-antigen ligase family protein [Patescibacteria group bacterium]
MRSLNSKDYIFITFIGFTLSIGLILFGVTGGSPYLFYLLSLIAVILVVINPTMLFWLFLAAIPLDTTIVSPEWLPISLRPFQLFGILAIAGTVIHWIFRTFDLQPISFKKICHICSILSKECKTGERENFFGWFDRIIFCLPIFALLGVINSPDKTLSLKLMFVLVSFVALFWLIRTFTQTKQQMFEALWFFAVGSVPVLFFGFYQILAVKSGLISFEIFDQRINGTFTEPDWFGMYLSILIAVILWFRFALLERKDRTMIGNLQVIKLLRAATIGDLFLMAILIILTVARSAWLGLAAVLTAYIVLIFIRKKGTLLSKISYSVKESLIQVAIILSAAVFIWGAGLSTFHIVNRAASSVSGMQKITVSCEKNSKVPKKIESTDLLSEFGCFHINLENIEKEQKQGREVKEVFRPDPNINVRKKIYAISWSEIKKHPFLGQGLGSSGIVLGEDEHGSNYNASNIFLESWLSMGIGGFFLVLLIFFYPIFWSLKNIFKGRNINSSSFVLLTALAVLIPNMFNAGLLLGVVWAWIAITARMVVSTEK